MNMFTVMVFIAVALTIGTLVTGIASMVKDHEVAHYESAQWMNWRVGLQALAVLMVLMAINASQ